MDIEEKEPTINKVEIFFCYAREDEELRQSLEKQLRTLQRHGLINVWHDRNISAGAEWEREIDLHLNSAHLILLLVSPDFLDSDYCYSIEMTRAMERHERGETHVIPMCA
jgi:TIR domain